MTFSYTEQEHGAEHDEQGAAAAGWAPGQESRELQSVIEMCHLKMEHIELITNAGRALT